jgi:hypothetical protein
MVSVTLRKVSPGLLEWLTQVNEWNLLDPNDHFTGEVSIGFRRKLSNLLKRMVGPCGLEPETNNHLLRFPSRPYQSHVWPA